MRRTAAVTIVLLLVVGCRSAGEIPCRPGFALAQDGHCYPPPPDPRPPSANDVLENIGPCVPKKAGDEIDFVQSCMDGVCANDTFSDIDGALGEGVVCEDTGPDWFCTWPTSVVGLFPVGEDDVTLPADDARTPYVRATTGYAGATLDGLGLGISPQCYVDLLGAPTSVEFVNTAGRLEPRQLIWDEFGVEIEDEESPGVDLPNGLVDELTLYEPL